MMCEGNTKRKRGPIAAITSHIARAKYFHDERWRIEVFNDIQNKLLREFEEFVNEIYNEGGNVALIQNMERIRRRYILSQKYHILDWKFNKRKTMRLLKVDNLLEEVNKYGKAAYYANYSFGQIIKGIPADPKFVENTIKIENIMRKYNCEWYAFSKENKKIINRIDKEYELRINCMIDEEDEDDIIRDIIDKGYPWDIIAKKEIKYYLHNIPLSNINNDQAKVLINYNGILLDLIHDIWRNDLDISLYNSISNAVEIAATRIAKEEGKN